MRTEAPDVAPLLEQGRALQFIASHSARPKYSIKSRLHAIVGLLAAIPLIGAACALLLVAKATGDNAALDRVARGTIHLERINGLIYAVVMESQGIYMSTDWQSAEAYAHKLTDDLVQLQDAAQGWKTEAVASQQANVDKLAAQIDEFVRVRTDRFHQELIRLNSDASAPASAPDDADSQRLRAALNDNLTALSHGYQLEIAAARARADADGGYFVWALGALAGVALIGLGGALLLIRRGLLMPLLQMRKEMRRLAEGQLDDEAVQARALEIAAMEHDIGVFRAGLVERNRLHHETQLLSDLNDWLQSCNSLGELYDMVAQFLSRLLPECAGSLYIYANSRDVLEGCKAWNGGAVQASMHPEDCWGLRRGHVYSFGEREIDFPCGHVGSAKVEQYCCIPVLAHGETIGLLHLEFHAGADGGYDRERIAEQRRLGLMCAEQISLAIANVKLRDQLRDQSIRDPLTGLFNRRYMLETCRREFSRAARARQPVSVLSIDVDHFKKFNDNHGHDAGDTVLREVGNCLEGVFRNEDVACRFGGEEFVVVLPGASIEIGAKRAEELRVKIEALSVRYLEKNLPRVTISVGVAAFPEAGDNSQSVLKAADDALYRAKESGRNRVELAAGSTQLARTKPAIAADAGKLAAD